MLQKIADFYEEEVDAAVGNNLHRLALDRWSSLSAPLTGDHVADLPIFRLGSLLVRDARTDDAALRRGTSTAAARAAWQLLAVPRAISLVTVSLAGAPAPTICRVSRWATAARSGARETFVGRRSAHRAVASARSVSVTGAGWKLAASVRLPADRLDVPLLTSDRARWRASVVDGGASTSSRDREERAVAGSAAMRGALVSARVVVAYAARQQ